MSDLVAITLTVNGQVVRAFVEPRTSLVDFLRDTGKHFTVNYMMAKDSVKSRLEREDGGISFTEFSYMLLQAYDYLHLHDTKNCALQAGGSADGCGCRSGHELGRQRVGFRFRDG